MINKEIRVIEYNKPLLTKTEIYLLASAMYDSIKKYYKDPKNMEAFKKWKKEKDKETK